MIKFGISRNYVPKWGVVQAIREVYQNFIDYGEFEVVVNKISDNYSSVRISNDFNPETWEFLKIGFSKKEGESIGKHGEGIKLAGLVFRRNKQMFRISSPLGRVDAAFYDDDKIGECYGLDLTDMKTDGFEVYFEAKTSDLEIFQYGLIKPEDILQSSFCGDIVNKDEGNIYVGGLYVCNLKGLKYALNFKPSSVDLGRDRDMPSTWDLEYYTNLIVRACSRELEFKPEDVYNREFSVGEIPYELSDKFKPILSEAGDIQMKAGKTIVTDENTISKISRNPSIIKKVKKLEYAIIFKQKQAPSTILTKLKEELSLNPIQIARFDSVIKLARSWKLK